MRHLSSLFLLAILTLTAAALPVVNLGISGSFGNTSSVSASSGATHIDVPDTYTYALTGSVYSAGGLLAPVAGETLDSFIQVVGGDPAFLQGKVTVPKSKLPYTLFDKTFSHTYPPASFGDFGTTLSFKMRAGIGTDGRIAFTVTNAKVTNPSLLFFGQRPTDSVVFTGGTNLFVGTPPQLDLPTATHILSEASGTATIIVRRSGNTSVNTTVHLVTAPGSAIAGTDFTAVNSIVNFAPGDTTKTVDVPILDNATQDGDRSFTTTLQSSDGFSRIVVGTQTSVIITDNESAGLPRIAHFSATTTAAENAATATLTFARTGSTAAAASISYATSDGTATSPNHYLASSGIATFDAGSATTTVAISLVDNTELNAPRDFTVSLSAPSAGSVLGSVRTARVSITDDEISDFTPFRGTYAGNLDSAPYTHLAAGFIKVTLNAKGTFTAAIRHAGKTTKLKGRLNPSGAVEIPYSRTSSTALKLQLARAAADHITATILQANSPITAGSADRTHFTKAVPFLRPGRYNTLLRTAPLALGETAATRPIGTGTAVVTITALGTFKIAAILPDGTAASSAGFLNTAEEISIHLEPYKAHTGRLHGRLQLHGLAAPNDLDGTLAWQKLARAKDRLYPAGFDSPLDVLASLHTPTPAGNRLLTFASADLTLSAGNLATPLLLPITINAANYATPTTLGAEKLHITLTPSTGKLSGKFIPPGSTHFVKFSGLILKKQDLAEGLFLPPHNKDPLAPPAESGAVKLAP